MNFNIPVLPTARQNGKHFSKLHHKNHNRDTNNNFVLKNVNYHSVRCKITSFTCYINHLNKRTFFQSIFTLILAQRFWRQLYNGLQSYQRNGLWSLQLFQHLPTQLSNGVTEVVSSSTSQQLFFSRKWEFGDHPAIAGGNLKSCGTLVRREPQTLWP